MVTGMPGIGKSTLLKNFAIEAQKTRLFTIYVKAGKGEHLQSLIERMAHESALIIVSEESRTKKSSVLSKAKSLDAIVEGIRRLVIGRSVVILFIIDDADLIREQEKISEKISLVLSRMQHIGFVLSGTNQIAVPMPEKFRTIKLRPFGEHEVAEFVNDALKKESLKIGDACTKAIMTDSEGNPRVIATICWVLYDKLKENEKIITKGHYLASFPVIMSMLARDFFDMLYEQVPEAERKVLAEFAKECRVMHISDAAKKMKKRLGVVTTLAMRLVKRGALIRTERGQYIVFTKLFGKYVMERMSSN